MNKKNKLKTWSFSLVLGMGLLFISFISLVSIFAIGHELNIKNLETLIMFVIVFLHFICGLLLVVFFNKNVMYIKKVVTILLVFTALSLIYILYELSSVKVEGYVVDPLLLIPLSILLLNIKVFLDFIKSKNTILN
ncbi:MULTISPECIES: hypothetical protein [unclassified Tenacibaculum]|uniref:hypothetical protein n=1 Tax=unclassified Tenacibaculum TaxID=2635139 RepID=UPI001F2EFE69|nr:MULTISPECIES: hypothetical protein [unclassified Tenacibaculum]MCF2874920.1 hypothetical protein [Tenacibaculum sp. Cn5-1]MCF2934014.1 hypothetical protein [Tenacibaculum sp. Cn5-34]MCG7510224.1 hypothetical protein [Tenacibaculum sp. Cn5-46]